MLGQGDARSDRLIRERVRIGIEDLQGDVQICGSCWPFKMRLKGEVWAELLLLVQVHLLEVEWAQKEHLPPPVIPFGVQSQVVFRRMGCPGRHSGGNIAG